VDGNALVLREWEHALRAEHKSDQTVRSYTESARMLAAFLGGGADLLAVTVDDLRRFLADLLEHRSPSTAAVRYRSLQQFYRWAVRDGLIDTSPMATMRPPSVPEKPVPVVSMEDLRKLLRACEGRDFLDLRDGALLRVMLEPGGLRRAEVIGLTIASVDLDSDVVVVLGKGKRLRSVPYGHRTGQAIARYMRARARHPYAQRTDALWLSQKGALTDNGLAQMLERRCAQAGITRIRPHQLRHTSAHLWLSESGGDEGSALRLFGWRSRQMLSRYASSAADERAHAAARRLGIGDQL
jgi:site-specific recombinase XerD